MRVQPGLHASCVVLATSLALANSQEGRAATGEAAPDTEADREALIALYEATGGPGWTRQDGWLSASSLNDWAGVTTVSGRVVRLRLANNRLTGALPPELGNLTELWELHLPGNSLVGPIPDVLGELPSLGHLDLRWNALEGPIPQAVATAPRLVSLLLSANRLTGSIPASLGEMRRLKRLDLSYNAMSGGIPPTLGNLGRTLRVLALQGNRIQGSIPPELGRLTSLERLYLQANDLAGELPPTLGQLRSLTHLNVADNRLTGHVPPEFGSVSTLAFGDFSGNLLFGPFPDRLGIAQVDTRLVLGPELCATSHPDGLTTYQCLPAADSHTMHANVYLDAATVSLPDGDFGFRWVEGLSAMTFVSGYAVVNHRGRPEWMPIDAAEEMVELVNEQLGRAGYSIQSTSDLVRLFETSEGLELDITDMVPEANEVQLPFEPRGHGITDPTYLNWKGPGPDEVVGLVRCNSSLGQPYVKGYDGYAKSRSDVDCQVERLSDTCPPLDWRLSLTLAREEGRWPFANWIEFAWNSHRELGKYSVYFTDAVVESFTYCPNGDVRTTGRVYYLAPWPFVTYDSPHPLAAVSGQLDGCMAPPGDCYFAEYTRLNAGVQGNCKTPAPRACKRTDSCAVLFAKRAHFGRCLNAREAREESCFKGGNSGHRQQIQQVRNAIGRCNEHLAANACT